MNVRLRCIHPSVVLGALLVTGCLNLTYVASVEPPALEEMKAVRTLGVARFAVTTEMNRLILLETAGREGGVPAGMGYPGVDKKVMVVVSAPDAAEQYSVTPDELSELAQQAWVDRLSGAVPFSYRGTDERWLPETVASQDEAGRPVEGFPTVVAIPKVVDQNGGGAGLPSALAAEYRVDAILAGRIRVYAEVIKALDDPVTDGMDNVHLLPGQYAVKVEIAYQWALFDGRDGHKLADGEMIPAKYFNPQHPRDTIFPLFAGIAGTNALHAYLGSPAYHELYVRAAVNAMLPYLYLFVPHFLGSFQEAEQGK